MSHQTKHNQQYSQQSIKYGNKTIYYKLIRSKRRKTCDITVNRDEIVLRVPFDISKSDTENLLLRKIKWISSKQKEFDQRKPEIKIPTFQDNSTLPYLGINYELRIIAANNINVINSFDLEYDKFIAHIQEEALEQPDLIRKLYMDWLNIAANKIFKDKVNIYSKIVGVNPTSIVIKNLRNTWGSLSKNGSITLNVNLVKATEEIIDYIIIHELCHFKIKGHSYHFWNYLKQYIPDYPRKVKWLEINSNSLTRF